MDISKNHSFLLPVITVLLAMLTAMAPMGIDSYLSSMPEMATYFGVKINQVELTLTIYFLGFAFGNFLGGPISDAFGRKKLALIGISIYLISSLLIPYSKNIEMVCILRGIQSLGGGFATVTPMLFIRDWYEGKKVARLATIIGMIMMFAPLLAPIIGTTLAHYWDWKSIFFFLAIYASVIGIAILIFIPESRAKEDITNHISVREFFEKYKLLFSNKAAVFILLALAFSMAGLYAFITAGSFIYLDYFKFQPKYFPLLFGTNVLLNVILSLLNNVLLKKYKTQNIIKFGVFMQLLAGIVLFIATQSSQALFVPVFIGIIWFVGSIGMIFGNGTALLLNLVPELSGSANAMIGLTRFLLGSAAGSMIALFHNDSLAPIGIIMLSCAVFSAIFLLLYLRSIRSNS